MTSDQAVLAVPDILERTSTPYMVVGSFSCNVYAFPRSNQDADFVIDAAPGDTAALLAELRSAFRVDPHDRERFSRRRKLVIAGRAAYVASAEDVVVTKLRRSRQARRRKDIQDARNVIALQGTALDWPYIERWCERHGTRTILDEIRRSLESL